MAFAKPSGLSSHGVVIFASYCFDDLFGREIPSTPGMLTRDLSKLSIPVVPKTEALTRFCIILTCLVVLWFVNDDHKSNIFFSVSAKLIPTKLVILSAVYNYAVMAIRS